MNNRELFYKLMLYQTQYKKPVDIGNNEFVELRNDNAEWVVIMPGRAGYRPLSNDHIRRLSAALERYATIPMTDDMRKLFRNFPNDKILANNGAGVITFVDFDNSYRLMRLNDCVSLVADIMNDAVYIDMEFVETLQYFMADGAKRVFGNEYTEMVKRHAEKSHQSYIQEV